MRQKGQIAPFLVIVIAVILLAIAATKLIGEAGFLRIRMANVSDSTLITSASNFCRTLNQIRQISLGKNGLMMIYVRVQGFLLTFRVTCCGVPVFGWPGKGAPLGHPIYITSLLNSIQLYKQAKKYAEVMPKTLRSNLYDGILGGALIDEPKPFKRSEVEIDPATRMIKSIDYNAYLERDANFQTEYRRYKAGDWWRNEIMSYAWNKYKNVRENKFISGKMTFGEPVVVPDGYPNDPYDAYLRVQQLTPPNSVSVEAQPMILFYLYRKEWWDTEGCHCVYPILGILPWPYAWISNIDIDNTSFGLNVRKKEPFMKLPFFPRVVEISHENMIRIDGNIWIGYEPKLER